MHIVYKITNKINNKSYVGMSSRSLEARWNSHLSAVRQNSTFRFHSAIRKYGVDSWIKEVIFTTEDILEARKYEEKYISENNLTNIKYGYNAKPGGCGGWIVPPEKYESWKNKMIINNTGEKNARYLGITNDEIVNKYVKVSLDLGYIPSLNVLRKKYITNLPKSFTSFRFNGNPKNLIKIVEEKTGFKFNSHLRTEEYKKKISESLKGKSWYHNDKLQQSKLLNPNKINNREDWKKGRKKYE